MEDFFKSNLDHKDFVSAERKRFLIFIFQLDIKYYLKKKHTSQSRAHPSQSGLERSRDSPITDTESDKAYLQIKLLAGKEEMESFMRNNNIEMIFSGSDCSLVSFNASACKSPFRIVPKRSVYESRIGVDRHFGS